MLNLNNRRKLNVMTTMLRARIPNNWFQQKTHNERLGSKDNNNQYSRHSSRKINGVPDSDNFSKEDRIDQKIGDSLKLAKFFTNL